MHIHLADASPDRGQYSLLLQNQFQNTLLSYHYRQCEKYFAPLWDGLLKIHLATTQEKDWERSPNFNRDLRPRVIIDSGAFTAFTTGKVIKPQDYGKWALGFKDRWEDKMSFLRFMNLDVIGDQDASWINQLILEKMGINPIPIVTYGADLKHLHRAINNYDYIALGGLVPYSNQKQKLQVWLDKCFKLIVAKFKHTGVMPKVHLLGITTDWVLKRYPCYSSDSSSWVTCLRFGSGKAAGIKQLPRYKESNAALAATIHTLRSEIKKYQKMEAEATSLWAKRGVCFE